MMGRLNNPCRCLVGNLMYLSIVGWHVICFAVNTLAQFVSNPGKEHWVTLQHLLGSSKGSTNLTLVFTRNAAIELFWYSDSDWATDDDDDRESTSAFCFKVNTDGSVVSWASKKRACVAMSSCGAEYVALALAAQEAILCRGCWFYLLFTDGHEACSCLQ